MNVMSVRSIAPDRGSYSKSGAPEQMFWVSSAHSQRNFSRSFRAFSANMPFGKRFMYAS